VPPVALFALAVIGAGQQTPFSRHDWTGTAHIRLPVRPDQDMLAGADRTSRLGD
jgi:hypothetical protein